MLEEQRVIGDEEYSLHRPYFGREADELMSELSALTVAEMSEMLSCGGNLALKALNEAKGFLFKGVGYDAIKGFSGVVFDSFDYDGLTENEKEFANNHVIIVSSAYGLLNPDDIIKPYRLDYDVRLPDGGEKASTFWKGRNTVRLLKLLEERGENTILNLLPGSASKSIDWKLVKRFADVLVADFRLVEGGETNYKTPHAGLLKRMRGAFLREIVRRGLTTGSDIRESSYDDFVYLGDLKYPGHPTFGSVKVL